MESEEEVGYELLLDWDRDGARERMPGEEDMGENSGALSTIPAEEGTSALLLLLLLLLLALALPYTLTLPLLLHVAMRGRELRGATPDPGKSSR